MKPNTKKIIIIIAIIAIVLCSSCCCCTGFLYMIGSNSENSEESDSSSTVAVTTELTTEETEDETEPPVTTTTTETTVTTTTTASTTAKETTTTQATTTAIRNEELKGRGSADEGRSEPDYVNVIGYAVVSSTEEYNIEKSENFSDTNLWSIPTYEKDKQFWNKTNVTLSHKTEVVVVEQILKHEGWGRYSGYLLVRKTDDDTEYYINVSNFITKPYWTYTDDLIAAAKTGDFVAEFNQKSDFYPTTRDGYKVGLDDGQIVLVTGTQYGTEYTNIKGYVWKEWKNGYGGDVEVYFNPEDLTILY